MNCQNQSTDVSYRESHKAKGEDYQELFESNGLLHSLWQLEQIALRDIADKEFEGQVPGYLDFACGTGRIVRFVSQFADDSTGVDISPEMLAEANRRTNGVTFIEGDLTQDDLIGDKRFDLITTFRFFPNAEPELRDAVMAVLVRHVKPGGLIVFNNHLNSSSLRHMLFFHLKRRLFGTALGEGVAHSMTRQEVRDLASRHGLEIVRTYPIGHLPMTEKVFLRPRSVLLAIEKFLFKFVGSERFAQYVLYACRRVD